MDSTRFYLQSFNGAFNNFDRANSFFKCSGMLILNRHFFWYFNAAKQNALAYFSQHIVLARSINKTIIMSLVADYSDSSESDEDSSGQFSEDGETKR